MSYSQLTRKKRYEISALNERNIPQYQIANQVNVDPSTISRELNRNASQDGYDPDDAHRQAEQRQQDKNRSHIDQDDWDQVEKLLQLDWSPEQIAGRLDKNGKLDISHEWIYQHVWQDKNEGGTLYENLRLGRENRKAYGTRNSHTTIKNRTSIEQRPDVVDDRKRVGDWEADLIIGKGHSGALVTLVERKTRFVMIGHVKRKTADAVRQKQVEMLSPLKDDVHTMTQDNGGEFAQHQKTAKQLEMDTYFAHPYSSWERGAVENMNGLIRQYYPKGSSFKEVDRKQLLRYQMKLNHRPRKCLNWKTPFNAFYEQ